MMTPERYDVLVRPLRNYPQAVNLLKDMNRALTMLCYVIYPLLLAWLYVSEDGRLLRCILVPGIMFVAVSVFRAVLNAPRPYEQGIDSLLKKKRTGHSFPSRHVFSAFMIAMTYFYIYPGFGAALLFVGLLIAVIRVVGGVHYPIDVLAGALIAILSGGIGFWIIP